MGAPDLISEIPPPGAVWCTGSITRSLVASLVEVPSWREVQEIRQDRSQASGRASEWQRDASTLPSAGAHRITILAATYREKGKNPSRSTRGKSAREYTTITGRGRMPTSSIWGHPNHTMVPSPNKANALTNVTPLLRDSARPTSIGTSTKYQPSYQQQQPQPSPFPQQPYNPRLSTSSVSSTGSAAPVIPMSPGQHSVSTSAGGGASSLGMGNDGSVYLSAASSLAGGLGPVNGITTGTESQEHQNPDSGFTNREKTGYEGYDGYETSAPMQMPINLEEDEDIPYTRAQGFAQQITPANLSINLYRGSDEPYLPAHQSQPMSIPFPSPGRLGPGGIEQYDGHSGHQMYTAPHAGPGGPAGNGNRKLQQPSPSRATGPMGVSISPLPWGRNNGPNANLRAQSANNGAMQLRGGMGGPNQSSGFERPTSAMSGRALAHGDTTGQREGPNVGKENVNLASNADGLQGLGIARAESPAMAVSSPIVWIDNPC